MTNVELEPGWLVGEPLEDYNREVCRVVLAAPAARWKQGDIVVRRGGSTWSFGESASGLRDPFLFQEADVVARVNAWPPVLP